VHVVDTEDGPVRLGLAGALAVAAGGHVHVLEPTRSAA
jgi:Mg-chelatase subunit ChlD